MDVEGYWRSLKRFGRVVLGGAIMGGVYTGFEFLKKTPIGLFIIPVGTALISGLGKLIREKWGVKIPF